MSTWYLCTCVNWWISCTFKIPNNHVINSCLSSYSQYSNSVRLLAVPFPRDPHYRCHKSLPWPCAADLCSTGVQLWWWIVTSSRMDIWSGPCESMYVNIHAADSGVDVKCFYAVAAFAWSLLLLWSGSFSNTYFLLCRGGCVAICSWPVALVTKKCSIGSTVWCDCLQLELWCKTSFICVNNCTLNDTHSSLVNSSV